MPKKLRLKVYKDNNYYIQKTNKEQRVKEA